MICDVCGNDVSRLKTKATGRWGLDLCPTCHGRLLVRERRGTLSIPALVEAALAAGGPPEWPLCEWCGDDVDTHGLGCFSQRGTRLRQAHQQAAIHQGVARFEAHWKT